MDAEVQSVATALGDVERAIPMSAIKGTNTQKGKQLRQWRSRLASLVDGMPPNPDTAFDDVLREAVELHDAVKDDAIKTSTLSGWRDRALKLQQRFQATVRRSVQQADIDVLRILIREMEELASLPDGSDTHEKSAPPSTGSRRKRRRSDLPEGWSIILDYGKVMGYRGPPGSRLRAACPSKAWQLYRKALVLLDSSNDEDMSELDDEDSDTGASDEVSSGASRDEGTATDTPATPGDHSIRYVWNEAHQRHLPATMNEMAIVIGDTRSTRVCKVSYCSVETSQVEQNIAMSELREITPDAAARRDAGEMPSGDVRFPSMSVPWPKRTWCRSKPCQGGGDGNDDDGAQPPKALELFAGTGRLSKALRAAGCEVTLHERYGERIEWHPHGLPEASTPLFEYDLREIDQSRLPVYDFIHASPECSSYSGMAQSKHQREERNGYRGVTPEARQANVVLGKLVSILQNQLERNPKLIFTIENPWNPAGGMHKQEIMTTIVEQQLGATRCLITYCMFKPGVKKPTLIWTNCKELAMTLGSGQFYCGGEDGHGHKCSHARLTGKHPEGIRGMGDQVRSAAFPQAFVQTLARCVVKQMTSGDEPLLDETRGDEDVAMQPPKRRRMNGVVLTESDGNNDPESDGLLAEMNAQLAEMKAAVEVTTRSMQMREAELVADPLMIMIDHVD